MSRGVLDVVATRRSERVESLRNAHAHVWHGLGEAKIQLSNLLRDAYANGATLEQLASWEGKATSKEIYASFLSRSIVILEELPPKYVTLNRYAALSGRGSGAIQIAIFKEEITDQILVRNQPFLKWEG